MKDSTKILIGVIVAGLSIMLFLTQAISTVDTLEEKDGVAYVPNSEQPFTGKYVQKFENGQKKFEMTFEEGKLQGLANKWHKNGQIKGQMNFKDGKFEGVESLWYDNGQKKSAHHYQDDKPHGVHISWHANGQKSAEGTTKEGELHGKLIEWHDNGEKQFEHHYNDGELHSSTEWDVNGDVVE
jgi:antitoxin component YwqK of YwqJK toxin-antitoxin module